MARVTGETRRSAVLFSRDSALNRRSKMDGAQPFRLDEAQVGVGIAGPSLRCSNFCAVGWVTDRFSFLGRNQLMNF
jgi:hypothetical protein